MYMVVESALFHSIPPEHLCYVYHTGFAESSEAGKAPCGRASVDDKHSTDNSVYTAEVGNEVFKAKKKRCSKHIHGNL